MSMKSLLLATAAVMVAAPAWAADAADSSTTLETIVVTARKQSEQLLQTPVAVTALSSKDIDKRGIVSIADLSNFTPSMNLNNNSSGRNDRSFQQIILRNMVPSNSVSATTSLFIDGVPVSSTTALNSIDDPERVEVLKGPQSAYFGRQTFAGAVNVVTKTPRSTLGGSGAASFGTRGNHDFQGSVEGPIVSDKLLFRATFRNYAKDGSYKNAANPSQTLGDVQTTSGSLQLVAKPIENLTIKALGMYWKDEDGPSAQGVILPSQSNCLLKGVNKYFCGTAPGLLPGLPAANTDVTPRIASFLANPVGRLVDPKDGVQGYGLVRRAMHGGLAIDYAIPSLKLTLSSLTGYNFEYYSELADLDNYDTRSLPNQAFAIAQGGPSYYDFPFLVERQIRDISQEFRVASDQDSRLRYQAGVSYLDSQTKAGLGGGNGALLSSVSAPSRAKTTGVFFGMAFDITSKLILNVDGRYQIDDIIAYQKPPVAGILLEKKFKNFMPRVIAQYKFTPDVMAYATYAEGINPGAFNNNILNFTPAQQADVASRLGVTIAVQPEKLVNYELGLKGKFLDGRATLAAALYYDKWTNQINTSAVTIIDSFGKPQSTVLSFNTGEVILKGIEADASLIPIDHVTLNVSGSINDSEIQSYTNSGYLGVTGTTNYSGKEMPNSSKYSAAVGVQYANRFNYIKDADWYIRGDYFYKSGVWDTQENLVKTPDQNIVNLRAGLSFDTWELSAFVTNLFNDDAYTTIAPNSYFHPTTPNFNGMATLVVGLPTLRTFGVKAKYSF